MARPLPKFRNFVGHPKIIRRLCQQLEGAKRHSECFPHTLLIGPSGVGKTRLGRLLADEYGTSMSYLMGDISLGSLRERMLGIKAFDFVFIDEAHNLEPKCQEFLYQAIDGQGISTLSKPASSKDSAEQVPVKCTFVLATDQPGKLMNAMMKRMAITESLDRYAPRVLKEIVDHLAQELNVLISPQASKQIAQLSMGNPRKAKQHLENLRRQFSTLNQSQLSVGQVRDYRKAFQIDSNGLGLMHRKYMRYLANHGKASQESLAIHLELDADFVRREIESALQHLGFLTIGSGGRQLTKQGLEKINKIPKVADNQEEKLSLTS